MATQTLPTTAGSGEEHVTSELLVPGSACVCKGPSHLGESSGADASC